MTYAIPADPQVIVTHDIEGDDVVVYRGSLSKAPVPADVDRERMMRDLAVLGFHFCPGTETVALYPRSQRVLA